MQPADRIAYLDGLRGVAIAMVILFHAYVRWPEVVPFGNAYAGRPWVAYGWLGVQLFFMISGFVIAMTLERCDGIRDFLVRRWLRLFPAMAIVSLLIFVTSPWLPERPAGQPLWRDLLPGLVFIEPGWVSLMTGERQGMLEGAFWSLFVEAKFYVIAGVAHFTLGRKGMIAVLLAIFGLGLVANTAFPSLEWLRTVMALLDARYLAWFAAGALFHLYAQQRQLRVALLAILVGAVAAANQAGHQMYTQLFAMSVVVLFSTAVCMPAIQRMLQARPLLWLGFVSYPLYLLHENLIVAGIVKVAAGAPQTPAVLLPVIPTALACALAWVIAARLEPLLRRALRMAGRRQVLGAGVPTSGGGREAMNAMHLLRFRQWLGVALREWPTYRAALAAPDSRWQRLCNRGEQLQPGPNGQGWRCDWQWTSDLHAPKRMPALGRHLLRRALYDHPIVQQAQPAAAAPPEITFLIGHRGEARLPHLLATLRSIAGQREARVECIVVEQDGVAHARAHLPAWVRHIHAPPPQANLPYCRSWALNVAARAAQSPLLVLHDNDMLVTADYARTAVAAAREGFEAINLKRFVFYMDMASTQLLFAGDPGWLAAAPEAIVQNLEAGGSVIITREAFERIGGMDEAFIGWGGEDNEFWERCQSLRGWPWGCLPIVHCWHAPQPGKDNAARDTTALWRSKSQLPVDKRIALLRNVAWGSLVGPQGAP